MTVIICACLLTDLQGKKKQVSASLAKIASYVDLVSDAGILDHVCAKLLPVEVSLEAHLQEYQCDTNHSADNNFVVAGKFLPAQKNEKQLAFKKKPSRQKTAQQFK